MTSVTRPVVKRFDYKLTIAGVDITSDIRNTPETDLLRILIQDNLEKSDSLTLDFSDAKNVWKDSWYPTKGNSVTISIGFTDLSESWLPESEYQIDEIELFSWDKVSIRATATPVIQSLRTLRTEAYENIPLKGVVEKVAARNGLTVEGEIKPISFERISQSRESDLNLLLRLSQEYGHIFKVYSSGKIIFYARSTLETAGSVFELSALEIDPNRIRLIDSLQGIYNRAEIKYDSGKQGKPLTHLETDETIESGELLYLDNRAENLSQAIAIAQEGLRLANSTRVTGDISLEGDARYNAGANFDLIDCGKFSGKWHINDVKHDINKSQGWVSRLSIRKIS
jgi:uncharacterized protein